MSRIYGPRCKLFRYCFGYLESINRVYRDCGNIDKETNFVRLQDVNKLIIKRKRKRDICIFVYFENFKILKYYNNFILYLNKLKIFLICLFIDYTFNSDKILPRII